MTLFLTRASPGYQRGSDGTWTSVGTDVLRDAHYVGAIRTTRIDRATTNFLLNSGTPATQSVNLVADTYTLWVQGSGSCALSGGPVGTATEGSPVRFTLVGTTNVTFTVTGSLTVFQCEGTPDPTAYVPTVGAAVTTAADVLSLSLDPSMQTSTVYLNLYERAKKGQYDTIWSISDTASNVPRSGSWTDGSSASRINVSINVAGGADIESSPSGTDILYTDHLEVRYILTPTGNGMGIALNGGTESSIISTAAVASFKTWASGTNTRFYIGTTPWGAQGRQPMAVAGMAMATGIQTMDIMRLLAGPVGASAIVTGTATNQMNETHVVAGSRTIILTLTNDTWVTAGATFDAQRQNIINGLLSSGAEAHAWNVEVKAKLAVGTVVRTSSTVVTITLSAQAAYDTDTGETIIVTIPGTAVTGANSITATPNITVEEVADFSDTDADWTMPMGTFGMGGRRDLRVRAGWVEKGSAKGEGTN